MIDEIIGRWKRKELTNDDWKGWLDEKAKYSLIYNAICRSSFVLIETRQLAFGERALKV